MYNEKKEKYKKLCQEGKMCMWGGPGFAMFYCDFFERGEGNVRCVV